MWVVRYGKEMDGSASDYYERESRWVDKRSEIKGSGNNEKNKEVVCVMVESTKNSIDLIREDRVAQVDSVIKRNKEVQELEADIVYRIYQLTKIRSCKEIATQILYDYHKLKRLGDMFR